MAINIKNAELDKLVRELAHRRGESLTEALLRAVREELRREQLRIPEPDLAQRLSEIADHYSSLPVLDRRSDDEILGYDENGIPG